MLLPLSDPPSQNPSPPFFSSERVPPLSYPPTLAHLVSVRLSTSSSPEARQNRHGNWATCLLHICRGLLPAPVCSLIGGSVSESSQGYLTVGFLWGFLPIQGLQFPPPPQAFYICSRPPSNVWLWASVSVSVSCWVEPFRGQLCWAPVSKHNKSIINNVRDWYLSMGWVSSWTGFWFAFPSVSAPSLHFL